MVVETPIPVWLDCDPGHDDAFAILFAAYHPAIRLLGISTVFGNASLEKTTWNASSILTAIGKQDEVEVYPGARQALERPPMHAPSDIHGESGLDGTELLPPPARPANHAVPAVEAMAAALRREAPGTAWLVATGAMTNAAELFRRYPDLAAHLRGLSIMGGAVGGGFTAAVAGEVDGVPRIGNWTQFAEFNVLADPEAAASLFANPAVARKTTLVPLDVTHLVLATREVQELLLYGRDGAAVSGGDDAGARKPKSTLRVMLVELLNFFAETYKTVFGIVEGPPLHDPLAVAAVLTGVVGYEIPFYDYDPRVYDPRETGDAASRPRERYEVEVITAGTQEEARAGGAQTGRTVVRLLPPGEEGVRIPRGLDIPLFWKVLEECCARADEVNARNAAAAAAPR